VLRRVLLGTALAAVAVLAVFSHRFVLAALVAAWSVLATREFLSLLRRAEIGLNRWVMGALNVSVVAAAGFGLLPAFLPAPIAFVLLSAVALRTTKPRTPVYGSFVIIYLGFLPAHLVMLKGLAVERGLSSWLVLFPLVLTWANDTAALLFGRLMGRHKLAPAVSPSKTVEGYVAGLAVAAILSAIYLSRFAPFAGHPVWWSAVVGLGLGTLAQFGDLFESIFKRAVGLKDSSGALLEHGGFLDRVDSLLFTIPAFYYLTRHLR